MLLINDRTKRILDKNPDLRKQWTALVPQGRLGKPEDLMGSVAFLLSEASQYVTGAGAFFCFTGNVNFTDF
jgi:NAD(P)-dependent dehydrogenase (short-subunit alcohol dehydrogenase family)